MSNKIIIDSHILLWLLQEPKKVPLKTRKMLAEIPELYISIATIWELGLKHQRGKLRQGPRELLKGVQEIGGSMLPVKSSHIIQLTDTPISHKDPFDLMLLAQARSETCCLLTADKLLLELNLDYVVSP